MTSRSCKCSGMHNIYTHSICNCSSWYMHTNFKSVTKIKRISSPENIDLIYHCLSLICLGSYWSICKLCLVINPRRLTSLIAWDNSKKTATHWKLTQYKLWANISNLRRQCLLLFFSSVSHPLHFMPLFYKVLYVSWWKYICTQVLRR